MKSDSNLAGSIETNCSICRTDDEDYIVGGAGFTICKRCFASLLTKNSSTEHDNCRMCGRSKQVVELNHNLGICVTDVQLCMESFKLDSIKQD